MNSKKDACLDFVAALLEEITAEEMHDRIGGDDSVTNNAVNTVGAAAASVGTPLGQGVTAGLGAVGSAVLSAGMQAAADQLGQSLSDLARSTQPKR
jgi:hypothetical protein